MITVLVKTELHTMLCIEHDSLIAARKVVHYWATLNPGPCVVEVTRRDGMGPVRGVFYGSVDDFVGLNILEAPKITPVQVWPVGEPVTATALKVNATLSGEWLDHVSIVNKALTSPPSYSIKVQHIDRAGQELASFTVKGFNKDHAEQLAKAQIEAKGWKYRDCVSDDVSWLAPSTED